MSDPLSHKQDSDLLEKIRAQGDRVYYEVKSAEKYRKDVQKFVSGLLDNITLALDNHEKNCLFEDGNKDREQLIESLGLFYKDWGDVESWKRHILRRIGNLRSNLSWLVGATLDLYHKHPIETDIPVLQCHNFDTSSIGYAFQSGTRTHGINFGQTIWSNTYRARFIYDCNRCPYKIYPGDLYHRTVINTSDTCEVIREHDLCPHDPREIGGEDTGRDFGFLDPDIQDVEIQSA